MRASRENAVLLCHPDTPCAAVESVRATVAMDRSRTLAVTYTIAGAVEQLRIPSDRSARGAGELWQHTCFELFVGAQNDAEYYEFNFSPSGEWAAYEFRNYRQGGPIHTEGLDPKIAVQRGARSVELNAVVRLNRLPGIQPDLYLGLGLAAVIEDLSGSLSYWALKHAQGKPDFHHADNFVLQIEPAVVDAPDVEYGAKA